MQLGNMGAHLSPMLGKKLTPRTFGSRTLCAEGGVSHHVADRHPGRLETAEELDPWQDGGVVLPLARLPPRRAWKQPDPFIVPDRMGA